MWEFRQKCLCVKIRYRVLTLPVAMLSTRSLHSATVLYSNSYYIVVASIFLVSAASCKAICKTALVRSRLHFLINVTPSPMQAHDGRNPAW